MVYTFLRILTVDIRWYNGYRQQLKEFKADSFITLLRPSTASYDLVRVSFRLRFITISMATTCSRSWESWLRRRRFLKVFTVYGPGSHLGHVTRTFIPTSHGGSVWFAFKRSSGLWGKQIWNCWIWVTLETGQWMTLTLGCHKSSCTHLFDYMYQLSPHRL